MLAGVRASLEASQAFEVLALNATQASEQEIIHLCPDVIIFDTSSVQPHFHYEPLGSSLQLIGIDPDRDQALVWSGQHLNDLSVQDLVEILQERRGDMENGRYGDGETRGRGDLISLNNQSSSEPNHSTDTETRGHGDAENLSPCLPITVSPCHPKRRIP